MLAYKIVMVGDFGVGKTSLVKRFVDNSFNEEYLSTIGVSISKKKINSSTIMLWDIEGHTEFKPILKQYFLGATGFIIVADIHRHNTINSIKNHIELCHSVIKNAPICISLNKSDLEHNLKSDLLEEFMQISNNIIHVSKTSAKNNDGVEELFLSLDNFIAHNLGR